MYVYVTGEINLIKEKKNQGRRYCLGAGVGAGAGFRSTRAEPELGLEALERSRSWV